MARLRLLDVKHCEHAAVETAWELLRGSLEEGPEIQNYVDCWCVRWQPSLLCDAQHL